MAADDLPVQRQQDEDASAVIQTRRAPNRSEVGVAAGVGGQVAAVGGDDAGAQQVVGGEPVPARQPADAAAEGVAGDADGRVRARQRGQPQGRGGGDDVAPAGAGADEAAPAREEEPTAFGALVRYMHRVLDIRIGAVFLAARADDVAHRHLDLLIDGLRAGAGRAEALGGPALTFDDMRSMGDGRDTGPGTAAP